MWNKILVVGLVVVMVVAGLFFLIPTNGGTGGDSMNGTATIFVEDEAGEVASAEFDLGAPSAVEMMVLSVGSGIRGEDFTLASTPGEDGGYPQYPMTDIKKSYKYWVWVVCDVEVSGKNIQNDRLTSSDVAFNAYISGDSTKSILYGASVNSKTVHVANVLRLGQKVSVNQGTVGKWCYKSISGATPVALLGSDLDNMCLGIAANAKATDLNGDQVQVTATYTFQLDVTFAESGTLSAVITNISVGSSNTLSMLNADILMGDMELARCDI